MPGMHAGGNGLVMTGPAASRRSRIIPAQPRRGRMRQSIEITGSSLTCAAVGAVARGGAEVSVPPAAEQAARAAWQVAQEVTGQRPVYGRTTGVGANRNVGLAGADRAEHGLRLLRSHAAGAGPLLTPELGPAMLGTRLNQ